MDKCGTAADRPPTPHFPHVSTNSLRVYPTTRRVEPRRQADFQPKLFFILTTQSLRSSRSRAIDTIRGFVNMETT
ncbi:MAG: hypothetical protein KatS3mg111_1595 [Pirellulaceae bacterium]|nr:MAG: hypothetical protein KatS3mg111_1595 [Pirellulaceae bacterium]